MSLSDFFSYGNATEKSKNLFGISLYQQKNLELRPEGRHRFSARTTFASASLPELNTPYLSQIPCSWGAIYFPEHWREFHDYLSIRLSGQLPDLPVDAVVAPGVRSSKWTRSWKKYFIEFAYLRGYVMLYPNYAGFVSLSTNHLEVGSHVKDMPLEAYLQKRRLFLLPLMPLPTLNPSRDATDSKTGLLDLPGGRIPDWETLPVLDLLGLLTDGETLRIRGQERIKSMRGCDGRDSSKDVHDVRGWLCITDNE